MAIVKKIILAVYLSVLFVVVSVLIWSWITGLEVYLQSLAYGLILIGMILIIIRFRLKSVSSYLLSFGLLISALMVKILNSDQASEPFLRFGIMFLLVAVFQSIYEYHLSSHTSESEKIGN